MKESKKQENKSPKNILEETLQKIAKLENKPDWLKVLMSPIYNKQLEKLENTLENLKKELKLIPIKMQGVNNEIWVTDVRMDDKMGIQMDVLWDKDPSSENKAKMSLKIDKEGNLTLSPISDENKIIALQLENNVQQIIEFFKGKNSDLRTSLEKSPALSNFLKKQRTNNLKKLREENVRLNTAKEETQKEIQDLIEPMEALRIKSQALTKEVEGKELKELPELRKELNELYNKIRDLKYDIKLLNITLKYNGYDPNDKTKLETELSTKRKQLTTLLNEYDEKNQTFLKSLSSTKQELDQVSSKLSDLQYKDFKLKDELQKINSDLERNAKKLQAADEADNIPAKLDSMTTESPPTQSSLPASLTSPRQNRQQMVPILNKLETQSTFPQQPLEPLSQQSLEQLYIRRGNIMFPILDTLKPIEPQSRGRNSKAPVNPIEPLYKIKRKRRLNVQALPIAPSDDGHPNRRSSFH